MPRPQPPPSPPRKRVRMLLPDPMLLSESALSPLDQPGWLYEVKYDGYRILAGVFDGTVQLRSRGGADYTPAFPEVAQALATLAGGPHILDGEAVVLDAAGRSDFNRLQARARRRTWRPGDAPVVFMAFDLLVQNGQALIAQPVERRKAALRDLLPAHLAALHYVEHFPARHGRHLYQQAVALGLEGLVAKRLGSPYRPGERSPDWLKVKVPGAVPPERFKQASPLQGARQAGAGGPGGPGGRSAPQPPAAAAARAPASCRPAGDSR